MKTWTPSHKVVGRIRAEHTATDEGWTDREIEAEPQFYAASMGFAQVRGGPITQAFISAVAKLGHPDGILDTRVHMLMPGMYPCIGGWHLDNIPRDNENNPRITDSPSSQRHFLCVVGGCSTTQFLAEPFSWIDPCLSYRKADEEIERQQLDRISVRSGDVVSFGDEDWHRGRAARYRGWRWFARITVGGSRRVEDKIRTQTQVYLENASAGW